MIRRKTGKEPGECLCTCHTPYSSFSICEHCEFKEFTTDELLTELERRCKLPAPIWNQSAAIWFRAARGEFTQEQLDYEGEDG